ncbi:unnamed protein product [Cyclocybe aegerita]|uniref:F-box domain-containing protein n=1 Tax=Cyclocybe aegerita TaxID=1973307 RepID=A0A8S0W0W0_CYCAE|nr:unnamed protein product [Cyclocybe aegerita]
MSPNLKLEETYLVNLPAELLLGILEDPILSLDDLYHVSLVSRRLHTCALSIFLSRKGIPNPEKSITLDRVVWNPHFPKSKHPRDALAGLNIATFLTGKRVDHLTCYFQYPNSGYNILQRPDMLYVGVERLSRFVQRLGSLGTVKVYLLSERHFLKRDKEMEPSPIHQWHNWANAFSELLNLIVEKRSTDITIQYDGPNAALPAVYGSREKSTLFSKLKEMVVRKSAVERALTRPGWENTIPVNEPRFPRLSPKAASGRNLTTLCVHSMTLINTSFLQWTLQLLEHSPQLTSLSFAHLTFNSYDRGEVILSLFADVLWNKSITDFTVLQSCWSLSTEALLKFINRLEHLVKLIIDRTFQVRIKYEPTGLLDGFFAKDAYPVPPLRHLQVLEAPDELVLHLLRGQGRTSNPHPLPQLRHLLVYPSSLLVDPEAYRTSIESWRHLLQQVENPPRLHPLSFALDMQADFPLKYTGVEAYLESRIMSTEDVDELLAGSAFEKISEAIFYHLDASYAQENPTMFCQWLKLLFPDLREVRFTCTLTTLPEQVLEMSDRTIKALQRELRVKCPGVNRLMVERRVFSKDLNNEWT